MGATIIYGDSVEEVPAASVVNGRLALPAVDLPRATGWELKPEGMCRDEVCIPIPAGREPELLLSSGGETLVDLTAFADYVGQPYVSDGAGAVWSFGESAEDLKSQLLSLEAPDFTLPAYDGREYSLAAFRGKKVLLLLWSSW